MRAGGRSFDDQAMNDDLVIDVSALDSVVAIDANRHEVVVEAGATWGNILDATIAKGMIPHVTVTTPGATAGGTLSANCISRSTPCYGHTGDHARSFELVTMSGERLLCSRTENADLFRAAVSGFGWFGVVTRATFDLLPIGNRTQVRTEIERIEGLEPFVARLIDASLNTGSWDAVSSVFSLANPQRGALMRSAYTDEPAKKTFFLHEPWAWYRPFTELAFTSGWVANELCHASYEHVFTRAPFVDELRGYTFCMAGNERAKRLLEYVGIPMRSLQMSYAIPAESLLAFLRDTTRLFREHDVYPSILDSLYQPADDFLLSSSNGLPSFLTTYSFGGVSARKLARLSPCLLALNDACIAAGGRLHLVKNVIATPAQLETMYRHALPDLARLKARFDPEGVLVNDFFTRAFGAALS
jgi:decaprenylphospho-beta-D-ribofuranose 2-oxidase